MAGLSRAAILAAAAKWPTKTITIPELGGEVTVRSLSARDRDAFEVAVIAAKQDGELTADNIRARYVVACVVDEKGKRLFADSDVDLVGNMPVTIIDPIYAAVMELNALSAADIEALAKNS